MATETKPAPEQGGKNRILIIINDGQVDAVIADHPEDLQVVCINTDFDRRDYDESDILAVPASTEDTPAGSAVGHMYGVPTATRESDVDVNAVFEQITARNI